MENFTIVTLKTNTPKNNTDKELKNKVGQFSGKEVIISTKDENNPQKFPVINLSNMSDDDKDVPIKDPKKQQPVIFIKTKPFRKTASRVWMIGHQGQTKTVSRGQAKAKP